MDGPEGYRNKNRAPRDPHDPRKPAHGDLPLGGIANSSCQAAFPQSAGPHSRPRGLPPSSYVSCNPGHFLALRSQTCVK